MVSELQTADKKTNPGQSEHGRWKRVPSQTVPVLRCGCMGLLLIVSSRVPAFAFDDAAGAAASAGAVAVAEKTSASSKNESGKQPLAANAEKADANQPDANQPDTEKTTTDEADIDGAEPVHTIGPGKQPPASLQPLIKLAQQAKRLFETNVDAYTCLLVKRETLDGQLESTKYIRLKIRERRTDGDRLVRPQAIYGRFLKPNSVAGREILYVENERGGDVLVRRGGPRLPNITLEISPTGRLARQESNYSIVQTGIRPMVEQILVRMESQLDPKNLKIRYFADAKVDGRPCQHVEVTQLERTPDSTYQIAKVYIDEEFKLPVYFASYAWPEQPDGKPILQEQYAVTKIDLNAQLTDLDFDRTHPEYRFRHEDEDEDENETASESSQPQRHSR